MYDVKEKRRQGDIPPILGGVSIWTGFEREIRIGSEQRFVVFTISI